MAKLLCLALIFSHSVEGLAAPTVRFFNSGSCPYAQRAWIALEECGVGYEKVTVDLENKSQEFQDLYSRANPLPGARAKVPLLEVVVDDDTVLRCESLVVADYVAERFGDDDNTLLPSSAEDRATMRLFTELCGSSFSYFPILRADADKQQAVLKSFKEGLVAVDAFLKHYNSAPFLFGDGFSLAENNAAPFVQRACAILPALTSVSPMGICDELGLVHLKSWMEAILQRPSVISTGVPKETMLERTKSMLERMKDMEKAVI